MQSAEIMDALAGEAESYWPPEREFLASILEVLHTLLIVTLKAHGAKRVPKQIQIPRPKHVRVSGEETPPVSMSDYIRNVVNQKG